MKKLIFMVLAATTIATFGFDRDKLNDNTSTLQDYRDVANAILAATNIEQVVEIEKVTYFFLRTPKNFSAQAIFTEVDAALAAKGWGIVPFSIKTFPKTSALAIAKDQTVTNNVLFRLAYKYDVNAFPKAISRKCDAEEFVELFNFCVNNRQLSRASSQVLNALKSTFQKKYGVKLVKKMLYRQGKSFVTKDGVNPCEEMMNKLTASLNAARLAGFNEWLSDVGIKNRINLDFLPPQAKIEELKEEILMGDKNAVVSKLHLLYIGLSADDYNAFIKRFNGDK